MAWLGDFLASCHVRKEHFSSLRLGAWLGFQGMKGHPVAELTDVPVAASLGHCSQRQEDCCGSEESESVFCIAFLLNTHFHECMN